MSKPKFLEVSKDGMLRVRNLSHINAPVTYLTTVGTSGTVDLNVKNTSQFEPSYALQIGETGEEQTEVKILGTAALAKTAGTLTTNLDFEHPADTPVYGIKWDQVIFQGDSSGTAGTAASLVNGTVTYQPNSEYTQFDYSSTHTTAHGYRSVLQSSIGTATWVDSAQSDWMTSDGLSFYSLGGIRKRIKSKLWDSSFIRDEREIDDWNNEFKDKMVNAVISVNKGYAMGTADFSFDSNGLGTITTADFKDVRRFEVSHNGTDWYLSSKMDINDFLPEEQFVDTHPYHAWVGDTVFQIKPEDSGGSARITFYRFGTTMVNDTDTLPQPLRPYTDGFVEYSLAQALSKDNKPTDSANKLREANGVVGQFVEEIAARDKSGATYMNLTEPISVEDGGL